MSLDMVNFVNFYILLSWPIQKAKPTVEQNSGPCHYPIFEQVSIIIAIRTMIQDQKKKEKKSKE